jgi:hypothetical protein
MAKDFMSDAVTAWAVVAAALGASAFTTGGSFLLEKHREKHRYETVNKDELKAACIRLMASAYKSTQKAAAMKVNMIVRSGFSESLDVVLHHRKPADVLEIHDYLYGDLSNALDAQAVIWILGDADIIKGAGEVIRAMGEMIDKSIALPVNRNLNLAGGHVDRLKVILRQFKSLTMGDTDEKQRLKSVKDLSRTCAEFGQVMRKHLGIEDIEAILSVFPGLDSGNIASSDDQES